MTGEDAGGTRDACRTDSIPGSIDVGGSTGPDYEKWSDQRLADGYRRNSILLREYGTDSRTIRTLCAIEERLRARDIDPGRIVEELDV